MTGRDERTGRVESQLVAAGSRSEACQFVLLPEDSTDDERVVVLRPRDSEHLDADPALREWVGRRVRVRGTQGWTTFVVDEITPL